MEKFRADTLFTSQFIEKIWGKAICEISHHILIVLRCVSKFKNTVNIIIIIIIIVFKVAFVVVILVIELANLCPTMTHQWNKKSTIFDIIFINIRRLFKGRINFFHWFFWSKRRGFKI